jgi:2-C-methyl-D-erythritol 4-phosphate cytidylyltransferase
LYLQNHYMKKYAVIVAGGMGLRMGSPMPKQFLPLRNKPVILHTIETFLRAFPDLQIIVVAGKDYLALTENIIQSGPDTARIQIVTGGDTRYHSVKNGLSKVPPETIVFVHDAVRCLVSEKLIHTCYEQALEKGNAIPAVTATDSIRIERNGKNEMIDRAMVKLIQTPQTFRSDLIKNAFEAPYMEAFTDEASVLEHTGATINLVAGEPANIKITTPIDMVLAEKILESREQSLKQGKVHD